MAPTLTEDTEMEEGRWCDPDNTGSRMERQTRHRELSAAKALNLPAVSEQEELDAELAELQAKRDAAEAHTRRVANEWERFTRRFEALHKERQHLEYMAECNAGHAEACLKTLRTMTLRGTHHHAGFNRIDGAYVIATEHLASKVVAEQIEITRQAIAAEIEALEQERIAFAVEHGITNQLPEDQRPKQKAKAK